MNFPRSLRAGVPLLAFLLMASPVFAQNKIQHVLLVSIDGMHSVDFANCVKGVPESGNETYCPNLATLSTTGVHYLTALTSRPSDWFPGLTAP